ncbi:hypothetical protein BJF85_04465 [Saccharomonospora sp. CUA-673]|nr:hypothetical protein BJF85_04465 [Saccharomonospora sp. CUA-673]
MQTIVPAYERRVVLGLRRPVMLLVGDRCHSRTSKSCRRPRQLVRGMQRLHDSLVAMVDRLADEHAR